MVLSLACGWGLAGDTLLIAVASNFQHPLKQVVESYKANHSVDIQLAVGSTGTLFSQIQNGAPFDLLLAADARRPQILEEQGLILDGTRVTYALGQLVVISSKDLALGSWQDVCAKLDSKTIVIANPKTAPYGEAARQVLMNMGVWQSLQGNLIQAGNVNKVFHVFRAGNADFAFAAYSSVIANRWPTAVMVPHELYQPISQQAVILKQSRHIEQAQAFLAFLVSPKTQSFLFELGYRKGA